MARHSADDLGRVRAAITLTAETHTTDDDATSSFRYHFPEVVRQLE